MAGKAIPRVVRALLERAGRETDETSVKLTLHITEDELDGGFVAEVVGLPGCMSQGETEEEAVLNTLEAYHEILEDNVHDALDHRRGARDTVVLGVL